MKHKLEKEYTPEMQQAARAAYDPGDSAFWDEFDRHLDSLEAEKKEKVSQVQPRPTKRE